MTIRLLILGTGGMANTHAEAFAAIPGVTLAAGVDTRPEQLAAFAARHGVAHTFASLDEALAALDKDRDFLTKGGVFSNEWIDAYIELKMDEVNKVRMTTHPVEFELYYSC